MDVRVVILLGLLFCFTVNVTCKPNSKMADVNTKIADLDTTMVDLKTKSFPAPSIAFLKFLRFLQSKIHHNIGKSRNNNNNNNNSKVLKINHYGLLLSAILKEQNKRDQPPPPGVWGKRSAGDGEESTAPYSEMDEESLVGLLQSQLRQFLHGKVVKKEVVESESNHQVDGAGSTPSYLEIDENALNALFESKLQDFLHSGMHGKRDAMESSRNGNGHELLENVVMDEEEVTPLLQSKLQHFLRDMRFKKDEMESTSNGVGPVEPEDSLIDEESLLALLKSKLQEFLNTVGGLHEVINTMDDSTSDVTLLEKRKRGRVFLKQAS